MIEVELNKIIIDEKRPDQIIVLKEKQGERVLPIIIGMVEASSIKMKLTGFEPPRPMTHDLLRSAVDALGGKLEKVIIDKFENNTFYAKLVLTQSGALKVIDSRPSDAVALAVRTKSQIFVEEEVLKNAEFQKKDF